LTAAFNIQLVQTAHVILNLFSFAGLRLRIHRAAKTIGLIGEMDPEPKASEAKQVQDDAV